jgi:hypothetical protein
VIHTYSRDPPDLKCKTIAEMPACLLLLPQLSRWYYSSSPSDPLLSSFYQPTTLTSSHFSYHTNLRTIININFLDQIKRTLNLRVTLQRPIFFLLSIEYVLQYKKNVPRGTFFLSCRTYSIERNL